MKFDRIIPFGKPWITDKERNAVLKVLSGDILTHGPQAHAFEREFSTFLDPEANSVSLSSGMAALHLAYWQMGIGSGDEVLVAAQTHVATAHAVEVVGATPIFIDCDPRTGNIDPTLLEKSITPRTRAIGLVHFAGIPCDMDAILKIAERHGLRIVEDCALAVGARYRGKHVGLFGDASCFSFYPVKHITTGDGGMFVSKNPSFAKKVAMARAFGVDRGFSDRSLPGMYDVPTLGINYRLSDINCSIGRQQIMRLDDILRRRADNFSAMKRGLTNIPEVSILDSHNENAKSSHYCLSVILHGELAKSRDTIVNNLKQAGIGTSIYYPHPIPRLSYYKNKYNLDDRAFPEATRISDHSIALPVGPHLTEEDVAYICQAFEYITKDLL